MHAGSKVFNGAALALLIQSAPAAAQVLTFVSATGVDTRPCTVQAQPCRTLLRAVTVTGAGGTIRILSDLSGQSASIAKSLIVDGGGNTMIGSISINNASAIVTLRGLSLTGRGAVETGVNIVNAAAVHIEDSTVERYGVGIHLASGVSTELFVADSVSRDNSSHGLWIRSPTSAKLTVDISRFENNGVFGLVVDGGEATVTRSVASGNHSGFNLFGATANYVETMAAGNQIGFENFGEMTLESCVARGNGTGLFVRAGDTARISNSVFTNNADSGVEARGTVWTLGNNLFSGNGTDVDGALTALTSQ